MKPYTVEVTWRVPEYTHLTVQADTPAEAIERALAEVANDPDAYQRTFDYENCGPDVVTGLWEGDEPYPDLPGGARCPCRKPTNEIWRRRSRRLSHTFAKEAPRRSNFAASWPPSTPGRRRADPEPRPSNFRSALPTPRPG